MYSYGLDSSRHPIEVIAERRASETGKDETDFPANIWPFPTGNPAHGHLGS